jgi:hypothetical protein
MPQTERLHNHCWHFEMTRKQDAVLVSWFKKPWPQTSNRKKIKKLPHINGLTRLLGTAA